MKKIKEVKDRLVDGNFDLVTKSWKRGSEVFMQITTEERVLMPQGSYDLESKHTIEIDKFGVIDRYARTQKKSDVEQILSKTYR